MRTALHKGRGFHALRVRTHLHLSFQFWQRKYFNILLFIDTEDVSIQYLPFQKVFSILSNIYIIRGVF